MKRLLFGCCCAAIIAAAGTAAADPNLLVNPGFEDNGGSFDGWTEFGNVAISDPSNDDIYLSGTAAAKAFGNFTGSFNVSGYFQSFTPTAGNLYEMSGFSFISSADTIPDSTTVCESNRMIAKIAFFDMAVGGIEIQSNEIIIGGPDTTVDQWNSFLINAPAPAGAMRVEALLLYLQPALSGGAVYVDDVSFCDLGPEVPKANDLANPSFDTDLSGWTTFGSTFHDDRAFTRRTAPGSMKIFSTFVPDSDSGILQSFAASEGEVWKMDAWAFTTCQEDPVVEPTTNFVSAKMVFKNSGGMEVGAFETVLLDSSTAPGTWNKGTVIGTAPPTTTTIEAFVLFVSPTLDPGSAYIDDVGLQMLSTVDVPPTALGRAFSLRQNAPNPFNPTTRISFDLTAREQVDLSVYDMAGRHVVTLLSDQLAEGTHSVTWDGRATNGAPVATGVYRYELKTASGRESKRMVLMK